MLLNPFITIIARYIAVPLCIALVAFGAWQQSIISVLLAGAGLTAASFIRDIGLQTERNRRFQSPDQIAKAQLEFGLILVFQVIGTAILIHLMWLQHLNVAAMLTAATLLTRLVWHLVHKQTWNRHLGLFER